jgi:3-isopropylmalate/(R)-2-methylmalate dehydratase large subunit
MPERGYRISWKAGFCVNNPTCGAVSAMSTGVWLRARSRGTTNRNFQGRMGQGGIGSSPVSRVQRRAAIEGKIADPEYLP